MKIKDIMNPKRDRSRSSTRQRDSPLADKEDVPKNAKDGQSGAASTGEVASQAQVQTQAQAKTRAQTDRNRKKPRLQETQAGQLLAWIALLEENNIEPLEFFSERQRMKELRERAPSYNTAAVSWANQADKYWATVRLEVRQFIFRNPKDGNYALVQWLLELLSSTIPELCRDNRLHRCRFLNLTDMLSSGMLLPLPVAAAMGLSKLSHELLAEGSNAIEGGSLLPPIYCAILGSASFLVSASFIAVGEREWNWIEILQRCNSSNSSKGRRAVYSKLLRDGLPKPVHDQRTSNLPVVLIGKNVAIAFIGSLFWKDVGVWLHLMNDGCLGLWGEEPHDLVPLLSKDVIPYWPQCSPSFKAEFLTVVYDSTLQPTLVQMFEHPRSTIRSHIKTIFHEQGLDFCAMTHGLMARWTAPMYNLLLSGVGSEAGDDEHLDVLRRLAFDPRFDPNLHLEDFPMGRSRETGSILHVAVSADHSDTVEFLLQANTDVSIRDECGRTPLMLVETLEMLKLLVKGHSVDTTPLEETGRNIWHLMAYTDELKILTWLWENDKNRMRNLRTLDAHGNTPLALAVSEHVESPSETRAIFFLLSRDLDIHCLRSSKSIAHQLVRCGNIALVARAAELGLDFSELDENDNCVTDLLKRDAPKIFVDLVTKLAFTEHPITPKEPWWEIANLTPLQKLLDDECQACGRLESGGEATRECKRTVLDEKEFSAKLSASLLDEVDEMGQDVWRKFCHLLKDFKIIVEGTECLAVRESFVNVAKSLIASGVLKRFETKVGDCGLACLSHPTEWSTSFNIEPWTEIFELVLDVTETDLKHRFFKSRSGGWLLFMAFQEGVKSLPRQYLASGLPIKLPRFNGPLGDMEHELVKYVLKCSYDDPEILELLVPFLTAGHLRHEAYDLFALHYDDDSHSMYSKEVKEAGFESLLKAGLDTNHMLCPPDAAKIYSTRSPLHNAVLYSELSFVSLLLRYGANPRLHDCSALRAATSQGSIECLKLLLSEVPDRTPWEHQDQGVEILLAAQRNDQFETAEYLLENTKLADCLGMNTLDGSGVFTHAARNGLVDFMKLYSKHNARFSIPDGENGKTAFHAAVEGRQKEMVKFLLDLNLGLEEHTDLNQMTALEYAVKEGEEEMVAFLKDCGVKK